MQSPVDVLVASSVCFGLAFRLWIREKYLHGLSPIRSALQTTAIGGLAALAAYAIASWLH